MLDLLMYRVDDASVEKEVIEILTSRPMSLMPINKLTPIIKAINDFKLTQILEIGTFAGGTTYILAKAFPNNSITTVDPSNFEEYFEMQGHPDHLMHLQSKYPELTLEPASFRHIQKLYKKQCGNITLITDVVHNVDISQMDCIIVDGSHKDDILKTDLEYCYANMKPGIIFIDDCMYQQINECANEFAKEHNLELVYFDIEHNGEWKTDLCAIITNPLIKL
jgi:hypothetical protein